MILFFILCGVLYAPPKAANQQKQLSQPMYVLPAPGLEDFRVYVDFFANNSVTAEVTITDPDLLARMHRSHVPLEEIVAHGFKTKLSFMGFQCHVDLTRAVCDLIKCWDSEKDKLRDAFNQLSPEQKQENYIQIWFDMLQGREYEAPEFNDFIRALANPVIKKFGKHCDCPSGKNDHIPWYFLCCNVENPDDVAYCLTLLRR